MNLSQHKPKTRQILKKFGTEKLFNLSQNLCNDKEEISEVGQFTFNPDAPFGENKKLSDSSETSQKSLPATKYRYDTYTDEEGHSFSRITKQDSQEDAKVELLQEVNEEQGQETLNDLLDFLDGL